jgi:rhodanese-related sulfurtransferase
VASIAYQLAVVIGRAYWIVMLVAMLWLVDAARGDDVASHISAEELLALIESGHAPLIVDVRTQSEYDSGHVPGAVHIPFYDILAHRSELAASSAPLILYCAHGPRAGIAKFQLWAAGVDRPIIYLDGHMSGWKAHGLPIESATDDPSTRDGP